MKKPNNLNWGKNCEVMSTQIDRQADTQTERCVQFNNTFAEATLYSNIWPIDALSWFTVRNHFRF